MNDGTKIKAELVGVDKKTDLAVLKFKPVKPLIAVKFGDSDKLRLGEWVIAIGNPFSLGGTVTAGIVSARNRDISSGPYDNYIQTDASINRGNSGGPLFNLDGEVVGVNTLIISPSGGSIGLGFAVPSKTVAGVVDQLRQFGELRRGWLGVRIQQVTDEIAESLNIKPARGALIAGVDDKGPAKPAGIEPGDVVVKFDGKDIKEPKDLSRVVADTAVGKEVDVVIIRKGEEETRKVTLGRLEDTDKAVQASAKTKDEPAEKPVTQKALGLDLATLSKDLRTSYKIKDSVKGVIITGVDGTSDAAEKRLSRRRGHRRGGAGGGEQCRRRQEARRPTEEGRQEVGPAAGLQRRRRTALRGAERAVGPHRHASSRDVDCLGMNASSGDADADALGRVAGTYHVLHKLIPPIALRIQQRGEVAVVDPRRGRGGDRRLGVVGDAEPGGFDHAEIVGAVADRPACRSSSRSKISRSSISVASLAARPRIGSVTSPVSLPSCDHQFIGAVFLKSDHCGDRVGEQREAAGDQAGIGAVGAHGRDQLAAARRRRDALFQDFVDHADRQTLQKRDALAQRRLELDLAAHGAFGDFGDVRLQPGEIGQFVDAFLADHGGIHVGQKKLLAPERPAAARQCRSAGRRGPRAGGFRSR